MSYVGEKQVSAKGYSGPAAVCAVRYVPVAGHRQDRPATKFMAENKEIEVWLAPVEGAGVLAPIRVSVKTMIGMVALDATEFATTKPARKAKPERCAPAAKAKEEEEGS